MSIWEDTYSALSGLGLPLAASALIPASGAERPDTYLVYLLVTAPPEQWADDREVMRSYLVQVTYYCRDGLAGKPDIRGAMTGAGFLAGAERELPYNPETRHYGLAMDFTKVMIDEIGD